MKRHESYRYVREQRRWYCATCGHESNSLGLLPCADCGRDAPMPHFKLRQWWMLYEVREGRARRVGTARTQDDADAFLGVTKR